MPTLAAIGHEIDLSLAELAADRRASTPSNAAELLVPDRRQTLAELKKDSQKLEQLAIQRLQLLRAEVAANDETLNQAWQGFSQRLNRDIMLKKQLLAAFNPDAALERGYALVRHNGSMVKTARSLHLKDDIQLQFSDGAAEAIVTGINKKKRL